MNRQLLSGHQAMYAGGTSDGLCTFTSVTFRSGPPRGATSRSSYWFWATMFGTPRKKAIQRPSGDQDGLKSLRGSEVSRNGVPDPIICTYTSSLSPVNPFQLNAIWRPSGANDG